MKAPTPEAVAHHIAQKRPASWAATKEPDGTFGHWCPHHTISNSGEMFDVTPVRG